MTDLEQTTRRLRSALDELVADVARAPHRPPTPLHPLTTAVRPPRRGWRRTFTSVSVAIGVAALALTVIYFGPRSTPPATHHAVKPIGVPVHDTAPGWIALPLLLPGTAAQADGATVATGPVPVPSTGTYEQAYQGPQAINPAELLITTVPAQPGALSGYAAGSQTVTVGSSTAYLTNSADHQLVWQTTDGVVVSLESAGMTAADVVAAAQLVTPAPAAQLGVTVSGTLPDGLSFVGQGFAGGDTEQYQGDTVFFSNGTCHAYTQVWAGSAADFAPVAIIADRSQVVSVRGTHGLLAQISPDTWTLLWSEQPGIDVRLQGSNCDLTGIAAGLRTVDQATWAAMITSLGPQAHPFTPQAPAASTPLPGGGTFGLAH